MKQKRWLIPLLVLFIGIFLPVTGHAMELKDTDESVVKWDTAETETTTTSDNKTFANYIFEEENYDTYDKAVEGITRYAVDLVGDRKSDYFGTDIPVKIKTDKAVKWTARYKL